MSVGSRILDRVRRSYSFSFAAREENFCSGVPTGIAVARLERATKRSSWAAAADDLYGEVQPERVRIKHGRARFRGRFEADVDGCRLTGDYWIRGQPHHPVLVAVAAVVGFAIHAFAWAVAAAGAIQIFTAWRSGGSAAIAVLATTLGSSIALIPLLTRSWIVRTQENELGAMANRIHRALNRP